MVSATTNESAYEAVAVYDAVVAVDAFPIKLAVIVELFCHFDVVELYTNGCPFVGPDIATSPNWDNNNVAMLPPPPDPPTFLNIPAGSIEYDVESVNNALFLNAIAPKYIAFCLVFSTSKNCSYDKFAAASTAFE